MSDEKTAEMKLLEWSRNGFAELERDDLKQAAEMLGVDYAPQTNNTTLRNKLCESIGMVEGTLSHEDVALIRDDAPPKAALKLTDTPPNLGPSGRWGGRYRRVRLVRSDLYKNFHAFPICWEGQQRYFHFDTEVDMAWPFYEALRNMRETTIIQELTPDGHRSVRREVESQALPFSDFGDVPGTAHLPRSMREYVQWLAAQHNSFKDADRRTLIRVMRWLHGNVINARLKDAETDDIRDELLTFIGVDAYADAA